MKRQTTPQESQAPDDDRGIPCPRCGCRHHSVAYVRRSNGGVVRRRRECRNCGRRFTTSERTTGH